MKHHQLVLIAGIAILFASCQEGLRPEEIEIITSNPQQLMHVLTINNAQENKTLRAKSEEFSKQDLKSDEYALLAQRMSRTVQDSTVAGVGIAGPQVGINRRIVVVQRFDKPGEPFEAYPNIRIISYSDEKQIGPEGCLSVPGRREEVSRSKEITIEYTDAITLNKRQETIEGFTAVIFQHETDHLEGILYIDRL